MQHWGKGDHIDVSIKVSSNQLVLFLRDPSGVNTIIMLIIEISKQMMKYILEEDLGSFMYGGQ